MVVGSKAYIKDFYKKLSQELKLKIEGPLQPGDEGSIFYLKRELQFNEGGIDATPSSKYIAKLAELLKVSDRRGRAVPHHGCLQIYDPESISQGEYLDAENSKLFRSALGICFDSGEMRYSTSSSNLGDLYGQTDSTGNEWTQETDKLSYPDQRHESCITRRLRCIKLRYGGQERRDSKPYMLELYSDSDWASCKVSRRSTSSGLIFLNSCLIHSHSRSQTSVYLSSMEAEILAATSLLTEAMYLKQVLRFFVNDFGGLGNQEKVVMRLRLDSTSAQAFFSRLGPGKAKHLSTRLLWTQQAMKKQWFYVDRKSTKENPADLNTKALSKERREFLMKRSGLKKQNFEENDDVVCSGKKKQLVKLLVNMIVASNLQGCEEAQAGVRTTSWILTWAFVVIIFLLVLVMRLFLKLTSKMEELERCKFALKTVKEAIIMNEEDDPLCSEGGFFRQRGEDMEEEEKKEEEEKHAFDEDVTMSDTELMSGCIIRHRVVREEALHTAANGDGDEHGADYADSDESFVEEESPRSRYQRYLQSTLEEVSDPDDWCGIHYGHATQDSPVHGEGEDESGAISPRSI